VTYPQPFVQEIISSNCSPVQYDTSLPESQPIIDRFHHIWTPDLRVLDQSGSELYRWSGYLPPAEFAAQLLAALGQARLRLRQFEQAQSHYQDVLRRFPTAFAAAEANYFLAVTNYRKTDEGNDLLHGWHDLEKTYPTSEWTAKQNFD
jgi:hypothetical protein